MIRRDVASGVLVSVAAVVLILSAVVLFFGAAAFSAMMRQCPDGNDCADARSVSLIALPLGVALILMALWLWRRGK